MPRNADCPALLDDLLNRISLLADRYEEHAAEWRTNATTAQDEQQRQNAFRREEVLVFCASDVRKLIDHTEEMQRKIDQERRRQEE